MADLKIEITVNDTDQKIFNDGIPDIKKWAQDAVAGKINKCWIKMQSEWATKLMNDDSFTDSIPSNKTDFINLVTSRSDYKTAKERNDNGGIQ